MICAIQHLYQTDKQRLEKFIQCDDCRVGGTGKMYKQGHQSHVPFTHYIVYFSKI